MCAGYTARQYAGNDLFRNPNFNIKAAAQTIFDETHKADLITRTATESELLKGRPRPAGEKLYTDLTPEELDQRWMAAGNSGGWDIGKQRFVYFPFVVGWWCTRLVCVGTRINGKDNGTRTCRLKIMN